MSDLLKDVYTRKYLNNVANEISIHYKEFSKKSFLVSVFSDDWDSLELKERMKRITSSLHSSLPLDYSKAVEILVNSAKRFSGFQAMFFPGYIETYGLEKRNLTKSLNALEELTKFSSAEFAIRPFIFKYHDQVMKKMLAWSLSKNVHVRRLASEGARSRLPWAMALKKFKEDPTPVLPILENLKDDPELYVRKSVANSLNDISKDHPNLVIQIAKKWVGKSDNTNWIIKHGLRTLLKSGDQRALKIFGYSDSKNLKVEKILIEKKKVKIGESINFSFNLMVKKSSKVRLEYKIYYLKSNGDLKPKVFKISEGDYERGVRSISKKQSFKEMTTRKHYRGTHLLSVVVNGKEGAKVEFEVI